MRARVDVKKAETSPGVLDESMLRKIARRLFTSMRVSRTNSFCAI
jgi:hypothetical protein